MAPFESGPGNSRDAELRTEIDALDGDHRHEPVALLRVGRGGFGEDAWEEAVHLAAERGVGPTSDDLLGHPQVADHVAVGPEEPGHGHRVADGRS